MKSLRIAGLRSAIAPGALTLQAAGCALLMSLMLIVSAAQAPPEPENRGQKPQQAPIAATLTAPVLSVQPAVKQDISPPLRLILPRAPVEGGQVSVPSQEYWRDAYAGSRMPLPGRESEIQVDELEAASDDQVVQDRHGEGSMPSPLTSFEGLNNNQNQALVVGRIAPPDTQGDVGPNHYVQWVNLIFAIWDKSGALLYGPAAGHTLWAGFGWPCETTNDGDPITLYDPLADRWLMSQFALPSHPNGPFFQCVAISTSPDPTGSWYRYAFRWRNGAGLDVMNDYPKFGVWPDAYYMTANQYHAGTLAWAGTGVAALERERMLQGQTARMVYFDLGPEDWGGMLPADLDGLTAPPSGAPGYFVAVTADEWSANLKDEAQVYEFRVDWTNPEGNSAFTRVATLPLAPFDGELCGFSQNCIPQPGTAQKLDAIADRLMYRLQYRNFGTYETLVSNLTVDADGTNHAGLRWFELRRVNNAWSVHQQGTYAPDGDHRWMGSAAMDKVGNLAVGYSVASDQTFTSVRYAGRLASDPLGTLPRAEAELVAGASYQAGVNRWGDYSMLAVDPLDDCTFWYTQQYVAAPGSWGNWSTRIGSFRFSGCRGPTGALQGIVREVGTGMPIGGAQVSAHPAGGEVPSAQAYVTKTESPGGTYAFPALPAGIYTVTAEAYGYGPQVAPGVSVVADQATVQDFALEPASTYILSGTITDSDAGWPLYARIEIEGYPGGPVWSDPLTGYYQVALASGFTYTLHVVPWVDGYLSASRQVPPPTSVRASGTEVRIEDFVLDVDAAACIAPGYHVEVVGVAEGFGGALPAGWTIVDNVGNGQVWTFNDPGARGNQTGGTGPFAIVDSDHYGGTGRQDTELRTPAMDFTGVMTVLLEFDTDYMTFLGADIADVDLSIDGGLTWTNVWRKAGTSYRGPARESIDVSSLAGGRSNVLARFHYYNAAWEWWWQVDNVLLGQDLGCRPLSGGLVVGNVYDDNTGEPLAGAEVANGAGGAARAMATPLDPRVKDAFYILFSPAGAQMHTASAGSSYGIDSELVDVPLGGAVQQDFYLPTGYLSYAPLALDVELELGSMVTVPLTLENEGGLPLDFGIRKLLVGFEPEGGLQPVEVTIPGSALAYGPDVKRAKRYSRFREDMFFVVQPITRPSGKVQVLLLTPDAAGGGDITPLVATLAAFPDLETTVWDAGLGTPTAAGLAAYEVVIVGNALRWSTAGLDAEGVGDALADYLDAGGKVIDTLFAHDYGGWELAGRYVREGYAPFTPSTIDLSATPYSLGTVYDPAHPVMDAVRDIRDNPGLGVSHQDVGVADQAVRLADWDDGQVFVAYNDRVVGINQLWFHTAYWQGDVPQLMHNAILFLAGGDADWLLPHPLTGTIEMGGSEVISVALDAGASSVTEPGTYRARLYLDNSTGYGNPAVPVTMTVVAAPECTPIAGVELTLVTTGTLYTDTVVLFRADLFPESLAVPYSYTLTYGDGSAPVLGSSSDNPLTFQHLYSQMGSYVAEIAAWNCDLPPGEAASDTVRVPIRKPGNEIYLPLVVKE
jgi:hypothetical protein